QGIKNTSVACLGSLHDVSAAPFSKWIGKAT
ncbi:MAG: hypothetical protein ACI9PU_000865, partial [Ascidiaceihabitans sp.]